jgi:hypothetical protein
MQVGEAMTRGANLASPGQTIREAAPSQRARPPRGPVQETDVMLLQTRQPGPTPEPLG